MDILTFINLITNSIIGVSIMLFIISVFGRADHPLWENKYRAYLAKVGLGITGCGAVANVLLSMTNPPDSDILFKAALFQHVGLSLNFCWLSWWQFSETQKSKQVAVKSEPVLLKEVIVKPELKLVPTPTKPKRTYKRKQK
jgi:hypothetical protein